MSSSKKLSHFGWIPGLILCYATVVHAQDAVIISASDMFNQIGQYYKVYANKNNTSIAGRLGKASGGQFWDFTTGPTDDIYRFDYVATADGGHAQDFPKAKFAERKTEQGDGSQAYLYLDQVSGTGRVNYGFYDSKFLDVLGSSSASHPFTKPITDFPDSIRFGDTWSTVTSFNSDIQLSDAQPDPTDPTDPGGSLGSLGIVINYSSTAKADAFGIVNLPGIGFGDALRVNELAQYDVQADILGNGEYQSVETDYIRHYYWIMPGHGIVAEIVSTQQGTAPPDDFSTAAQFIRMFETNHGNAISLPPPPTGITGLKATFGPGRVLLNWDAFPSSTTYKIEATSDLSNPNSWIEIQSTTNLYLIDSLTAGTSAKFYRVRSAP